MENIEIFVTNKARLQLELTVYNLAKKFLENYHGGSWHFCENGNFWFLTDESHVDICNQNNYFEARMTSKSAGISLCMTACSLLSMSYFEKNPHLSDFWTDYYYFLREFALNPKNFSDDEQNKIFRFLD